MKKNMKHLITWASIPTTDFDRAVAFYSTVTGKDLKVQGEGDQKMATSMADSEWQDGTIGFGVTADSTMNPGSDGLRVYLAVEDMEGFLGKVEGAGGEVITPKSAMGELGFWALIKDTEGNQVGLHSSK
jgi:predicted enzyme related to lactoylglutathione lyase